MLAPGLDGCKQHISAGPWRWSPCCSQQCGGLGRHKHGVSHGGSPMGLLCPVELGVVEDKNRFFPVHWDLPSGLDFSSVPSG